MAGVPNFLQAIVGGYEAGSQQAERSRLRDLAEQGRALTGKALGGDQNALAQLGGVDPNAYMNVSKFTQEQKAARLDELASGAMAADTPEKWAAFVQQAEAQGHRLAPGETRESIINQAMGWKEKLAQQDRDRSYNLQKTTSDRSYGLQRDELAETKRYHDASLAAKDQTSDIQEYNFALSQGFKGSFVDFKNTLKGGNELSVTLPDGTVVSQGPSKITEGQGKDMGYLNRMTSSLPTIDKYENSLLSLGEGVGGKVPVVGNYMKSEEYQQAEQAGNNFLTALLRKESGATVPPAEQKAYGAIFLPQPGDKPATIAQKREARRQAAIGVKMGIPAPLIKSMIQQGVDFTTLEAPGAGSSGKSDQQQFTPDEIDQELRRRGALQ